MNSQTRNHSGLRRASRSDENRVCIAAQVPQLPPAAAALVLALALQTGGFAQVGSSYCMPVPNSTGLPARISATGSSDLSMNNNQLALRVDDLPPSQFGFFITSRTQAFVANPGGSQGNLCLGGTLGRYVGPGQLLNAGAAGSIALVVDLSMTPEGGGFVQVVPGDTWNFQAWYRDTGPVGQAWSNFSDGLEVLFTGGGGGTPIPGMMPIPAGTFMMGSNAPSAFPYYNGTEQQPVHQVTISNAFWMGQHEVTQAEYQALMGSNPSWFFNGATRPVERVNWHQARAYCTALTAQQAGSIPSGFEYRLPTEAEWEYACRAGTSTEFHYGPGLLCNQARFRYSNHSSPPASCGNQSSTVPVGGYAPNAFGLYDMHGNVWEWCLDSYAAYSSAAVSDPFVTGGPNRVIRGGSWYSDSGNCRSAIRINFDPGFTNGILGFRVVLAPVLVP